MKFFPAVLFSLFLSACASLERAPSPPVEAVRLVAEQPRLRSAAAGGFAPRRRAGFAEFFRAGDARQRKHGRGG